MTEDSKLKRFDDSPYDTIVFDEIYFHDIRKLARIKHYCEKHPEKNNHSNWRYKPTGNNCHDVQHQRLR